MSGAHPNSSIVLYQANIVEFVKADVEAWFELELTETKDTQASFAACILNLTPCNGLPVNVRNQSSLNPFMADPSSLSNRCRSRTVTYPASVSANCCPKQILLRCQYSVSTEKIQNKPRSAIEG